MKEKTVQATEEGTGDQRARAEIIPTKQAQDLLGERGILRIEHEGEVYTLRITRNNRLILTK